LHAAPAADASSAKIVGPQQNPSTSSSSKPTAPDAGDGQEQKIQMRGQGLRVLALDGGGIRGLSELLILFKLMEELKELTGATEAPHPADVFDIICGTSTGGLVECASS
jgi:hypothetical protein